MSGPTRRAVLGAGAGAAALWLPRRAPAVIPPSDARPLAESGVMSGDVSVDGAVVWSRADRPSTLRVECATDRAFTERVGGARADALIETDFTAKVGLTGLPPGRTIYYRATFESLAQPGVLGEPLLGQFRTPSLEPTATKFIWSGDTCGQGYGINLEFGGMRMHTTIRRHRPDFFVHCGDLIYADAPIKRRRRTKEGKIWTNLTLPGKHKVAETLDEFRAHFRYNLLDEPFRRQNAEVPMMVQWDDHETKNNWWPGRILNEDRRYTVKSCDLLAARGRKAFFEYTPIAAQPYAPGRVYRQIPRGPLVDLFMLDARTYRGPNSRNRQTVRSGATDFFGQRQLDWLVEALSQSKAAWKVVASDQPLSLLIGSGRRHFEGIGNVGGKPLGRELELAWLLSTLKQRGVKNVVWVTADVHYAAAYHYTPERAAFRDFDPFWEFVAGPINAATFGPNAVDRTFGARPVFVSEPKGSAPGRSPFHGRQFFGVMEVDPRSKALQVELRDLDDALLFEKRLSHQG